MQHVNVEGLPEPIVRVLMEESDVCGDAFFHEETVYQSADHRR